MPSGPNQEFGDPSRYPYLCVASPSCHDTSTTCAWFNQDSERRQRYHTEARSISLSHVLHVIFIDDCMRPDLMASAKRSLAGVFLQACIVSLQCSSQVQEVRFVLIPEYRLFLMHVR